ncbi:MAG: ABC transporter ATP-binding protein [Lachnospiraceae bacterium]|nr:ABC transporter ATP-binding protein [Lachnospiraceae bacterium]
MGNQNQNKEVMIQLSNVKKRYRLGQIGGGTLQGDIQSWWAKVRGKEDPNTIIGTDQRSNGETFMALNGIDLTIYKGEAVGIIGSNGAGKSTLLKLLSRVTAPTDGEIDTYGRIASMLEVGTGFSPEMTGRENVYMNGAILGMTKAEIDAKMEDIIEFSEVREFIDTPVKRYSSGMYVKLAFSVAAHLDSEIMIMDEVLAVGDMAFQKKCLEKMRDAAKKDGRTVLYVSHNMNTIRQLCDRCIVLDKGRVVFEGDVEKAIEVYLGSKSNSESFVDLSQLKRDPEFRNLPLHMHTFEAEQKENSIYDLGTSIKAKISFICDKKVENAFLRIIIKTIEGSPVTMITNDEGFRICKGEMQCVEFVMDTSRLVPGRYSVSPVFYEVNNLGVNMSLDGLKEIYCFEIATVPGFNHNMIWPRRYWGDHYSNPLIICDRERN